MRDFDQMVEDLFVQQSEFNDNMAKIITELTDKVVMLNDRVKELELEQRDRETYDMEQSERN